MLQLLRLVHVHEEVLQQLLGLHQTVCVYFLVDHGYILSFTVGVLHRSHVQQFLRVRPVCFWRKRLNVLIIKLLFNLMFGLLR